MNKRELQHFKSAQSESWWDGPARFGNVNRNPVTWIQSERDYQWLMSLFPKDMGHVGIEIGGGGNKGKGMLGVHPLGHAEIIDDGRTLATFENESLDYICSKHTMEHIDQHPVKTLARWMEVLKPGGIILIIMPDKNHFLHDPNTIQEFDSAPYEMEPKDMLQYLDELDAYYLEQGESKRKFDLIMFNTRDNNFDFETVIRKR